MANKTSTIFNSNHRAMGSVYSRMDILLSHFSACMAATFDSRYSLATGNDMGDDSCDGLHLSKHNTDFLLKEITLIERFHNSLASRFGYSSHSRSFSRYADSNYQPSGYEVAFTIRQIVLYYVMLL